MKDGSTQWMAIAPTTGYVTINNIPTAASATDILVSNGGVVSTRTVASLGIPVIVAGIARNPKNVREYYRHAMTNEAQLREYPRFVPLRDIAINTTSNLARLNGSELQRGIKSALLSEPQRSEPLEELFIK